MRFVHEQLQFVRNIVELPEVRGGILPYINHSTVVRNLKIVRKSKVNGTQFHFF